MGPLIPRPAITLIAVMVTCFMGVNMWLDYQSPEYDGRTITIACTGIIGAVIGREIFFRGKPGDDQ